MPMKFNDSTEYAFCTVRWNVGHKKFEKTVLADFVPSICIILFFLIIFFLGGDVGRI